MRTALKHIKTVRQVCKKIVTNFLLPLEAVTSTAIKNPALLEIAKKSKTALYVIFIIGSLFIVLRSIWAAREPIKKKLIECYKAILVEKQRLFDKKEVLDDTEI